MPFPTSIEVSQKKGANTTPVSGQSKVSEKIAQAQTPRGDWTYEGSPFFGEHKDPPKSVALGAASNRKQEREERTEPPKGKPSKDFYKTTEMGFKADEQGSHLFF